MTIAVVSLLGNRQPLAAREPTDETRIRATNLPPDGARNPFYVSNRSPLTANPLIKLPPGSITSRGWLRAQLESMADGMIGRMAELSPRVRPSSGWLRAEGVGDEWVPYWLKGFVSLGYALNEQAILNEAQKWLHAIMANQAESGLFGPKQNHYGAGGAGSKHLWPQMLVLFAMQTYYDATNDARVLEFMKRYFRYQMDLPPDELLTGVKWMKLRGGDNLESIYWLYNRTGEPWLLDLGARIHARTADWTGGTTGDPVWKENMPQSYPLPSDHGVNITMGYRQPGVYYQQSKDPKHSAAVERIYSLVMGQFGQMPGGMFGADERLRPGKVDPRQAAETCSVVEFMYSNESLLRITGKPKYADRCENIALNTYPATMTPDMKALHYLTAPNMPQCDAGKKPCFRNNEKMLSFSTGNEYYCCKHNHGQGWPYYAEHLWMATHGGGLAAVLYAPCSVEAKVGDGVTVKITEHTDYPFGETVDLTVSTPRPVRFPLMLRIPGWCHAARVIIGKELQDVSPGPCSNLTVERVWRDGDRVRLELPMEITLSVWRKNKNSVSVNRGPLTYSLKIGEKWVASGGSDKWPEWEVLPTTPWNYALLVDLDNPADSFTFVKKNALPKQPFVADNAPVELRARGRRIASWEMVDNCVGELPASPVRTDQPLERITLIPMGCARLRISAFPILEVDVDGRSR